MHQKHTSPDIVSGLQISKNGDITMSNRFFIIDSTRHRGDFSPLVNSVRAHLAKYPDSEVKWIPRPDQTMFLDNAEVLQQVTDATVVESLVREFIPRAANNGHADSVFHVLSYDPKVLGSATAMNSDSCIVIAEFLANLRGGGHGASASTGSSGLPFSPSFTLHEAVDLAKRVLREGGHTSRDNAMHQPQLRPKMANIDTRARRVQSDRRTWPLIAELVKHGTLEGWLRQERRGPTGYEYVWLVEPSQGAANRDGVPENPEDTSDTVSRLPPVDTDPKAVAKEIEDAWRRERISSPPAPRQFVFEAAEEYFSDDAMGTIKSLTSVVTEVAKAAATRAERSGYDKPTNWPVVTECVFNAMVGAQVVLTADGSVPCGIGQRSAHPTGLADDFRNRTLAFMVERIIQRWSKLEQSHLYPIGLALYQQGRANFVNHHELLARVDSILKVLLDAGRIKEQSDGAITAIPHIE
jgi:hypothetical protein